MVKVVVVVVVVVVVCLLAVTAVTKIILKNIDTNKHIRKIIITHANASRMTRE